MLERGGTEELNVGMGREGRVKCCTGEEWKGLMLERGGREGFIVVEWKEGRVKCWRGEGGKG